MQQPSVLLRRNPRLNKKDFGHVLVVAGSKTMLGACALCSLSAMRSGAGLVTAAVAKSLNLTLQKKISPVIMTLPLPENSKGELSLKAFDVLKKNFSKYVAIAIGPGLGLHPNTQQLIYRMVENYAGPMVVDADALNALAKNLKPLRNAKGPRILTPHLGEMNRLMGQTVGDRKKMALDFVRQNHCVLVLKGPHTLIASKSKVVVNATGNVGMATAGSGDVLTGMIVGILGQGVEAFQAAQLGVYYHGKAGDKAAQLRSKASMIATDIIENIKIC